MAGHGTGTFETLVHLDELHGRGAVPDDFGRGTIPADPMASPDYLLIHSGRFCPAHLRARHEEEEEDDNYLMKIGYLFELLAKTSSQLESVFSYPALFVLVTTVSSSTANVYLLIYQLVSQETQGDVYLQISLVLLNVLLPLVVITAADLPSEQVKLLRERLMMVRFCHRNPSDEVFINWHSIQL